MQSLSLICFRINGATAKKNEVQVYLFRMCAFLCDISCKASYCFSYIIYALILGNIHGEVSHVLYTGKYLMFYLQNVFEWIKEYYECS